MLAKVQATAQMRDGKYVGAASARFVFNHQLLSQTLFYEVWFKEDGRVDRFDLFFRAQQIFGFVLVQNRKLCPIKFFVVNLFVDAIQMAVDNSGIGEHELRFDDPMYLNIVENLCLSPPIISARPKPR